MDFKDELSDAEKHASYINLIETVSSLSRGEEHSDEWIDAQIKHVQLIRRCYTDMSLVNLERQDLAFRNIAKELELYLSELIVEIDVFGTLNITAYGLFCKGALCLMDMLEEDDILTNAFANLLR